MDERLQLLISDGADVTIKLSKSCSFIQLRKGNETFKASAGNLPKAIDRVLDAYNGKTSSIRGDRKKKERQRERLLEGSLSNLSLVQAESFSEGFDD